MLKGKWFENDKILLSLLTLFSAAVRIFFLLKFDNMPGDAAGHVERALRMIEDPGLLLNFDGNSSTLYKYALASFMCFWHDPVLAPRVFTCLFGILLAVPYYGTLKILFGRAVAFFSTLVLAFYPLHVIQSSVTTSDAVYYFFLFGSFYYFFSYKITRERLSALLLSALSFNIASLLRFESWIFIPVFFFLLWPKGKKPAFLFLILSLVFPCALLALNQIVHRDFLYSFHAASKTAHTSIAIGRFLYDPRWWSWLAVLWQSSGAALVIGGLSGIILAFLTRQKRQLAVFFLVLLSAFTVNTLSARMVGGARYSIILALFLIPYAWFFVDQLLVFLRLRKIIFFILILLSILTIDFAQASRKEISQTTEMLYITPPGVIRVGTWLKEHVRADETLIISNDPHDCLQTNIMLRSGISHKRCLVTLRLLSSRKDFENKKEFKQYIWKHRTNYLVLNSESYLQEILNLDLNKKSQDFGDAVFELAFEENVPMSGKFIIYRISYKGPPEGGGDA